MLYRNKIVEILVKVAYLPRRSKKFVSLTNMNLVGELLHINGEKKIL